jgi:proline racemase
VSTPHQVERLGKIQAVTRVNGGETFVAVDWRKCMLGMSPATTRELAAALLAVADEAEAIDAAAAAKPAQDALWEGAA